MARKQKDGGFLGNDKFSLPAKGSLPRDEEELESFVRQLACAVVRRADSIGDRIQLVVGETTRMVKINEALEEAKAMLHDHYSLGEPKRPAPRTIPIGLGLQLA